jgi:iron complex outermembrane recepter protein
MLNCKWLVAACACGVPGILLAAESGPTAPPDNDVAGNSQVEEVVVTGTRLAISGNSAPTPVTVISQEQMQLASPTTLADALAQVPEFRSSTRPGTFLTPQGPTGAFLSLRGLGQARVLTLLDGRRVVPTTLSERVDINTFPDLLIKRTDVVTGGASAAYGSDAVAGVVNFVLDQEFQGIKGDLGAGVSSRNDNGSRTARLAFGTQLLNGRGHLTASIDYFKSEGVTNVDKRSWDLQHCNVIPNPTFATDNRPKNLWRCGVNGIFATGGMVNAGPLKGTQFLSGGTPATFNYGTEVSTSVMVGGDGYWNPRGSVATPLSNKNAFMHYVYDVSDALRVFAEGSYSETGSDFFGTSPSYVGTTGITIYSSNAFLDPATRARLGSATSFALSRISPDWGRNEGSSDANSYRGAAGFNWNVGKWQVDGAVDSGRSHVLLENNHSPNQIKLFEALDSVISPTTGLPICRSMLNPANAARGCVPLDPFGPGSASPQAIQYVFGDKGYSNTYLQQSSAEANLRGSPFRTWAGEVAMATGVAWRRFQAEQVSDPLSQTLMYQVPASQGMPATLIGKQGVFLTGNQSYQPRKSVSVDEAYVELQVPLARNLQFLHAADINGAFRYADYSTTGGVNAWKVGGSIEPMRAIRFRFTRSRDVRAPNINELYAPGLPSLGTILDPLKGSNNNIPIYQGGNPALVPEIANTTTLGIVLRPDFVPELSLAVDYYNIEIGNSIGNVGNAQNIVNFCFQGLTAYCPLVSRLPDGTLSSVSNFAVNQSKVVDSGIDAELNYSTSFGQLKFAARALASYLRTLATTDVFGTVTEQAGVNGGENNGTPKWQGSLGLTFGYRNLTAFIQERFIGGGLYSNQYVVGGKASNSIDYNHVDGRNYTDLTLRYDLSGNGVEWQLYGTINNLMDRDPPASPTRTGLPASILGTNPTLYDVVGRQYTAGVRFKL